MRVSAAVELERRNLELVLRGDVERCSARGDGLQPRCGGGQRRHQWRRVEQVLEVVEYEQELMVGEEALERFLRRPARGDAKRARNRRGDERSAAHRCQLDEGGAVSEAHREAVRQLEREPRLADAAGAGERQEPHAVLSQQPLRVGELAASPEQRRRRQRHRVRMALGDDRLERGIVVQDRALQTLKRRTRLDAELIVERPSRALVLLQRVCLPIRPVEREHQLATQALPQRLGRDERLELSDEFGVSPKPKVGLDPLLARCGAKLLEPGRLRLRLRLEVAVREHRPAPKGQCLAEDA